MKLLHCDYDISTDVFQCIERSGIDPEALWGKTVLITGGTGFFGIWLLSALVILRKRMKGNLRLIVLSRSPQTFLDLHRQFQFDAEVEFIKGDVKSFLLDPSIRVTHLVHMAATNANETFAGEDQLAKLDLLYSGTRHVLEECGSSLEHVLFSSSGVAYGVNHHRFISESDHTAPDSTQAKSALGIGKLTAEYLIAYYAAKFGFSFSIARCFAFAGQYLPLDLHYAFGNFIRNALEGTDIEIHSDGQDLRSYLYIGDAIAWLLRLLVEPKNKLFNVGSAQSTSIENLALKVAAKSGKMLEVHIQGGRNEVGNFRRTNYVPSIDRITSHYPGIREWTSLEKIIDKMMSVRFRTASTAARLA